MPWWGLAFVGLGGDLALGAGSGGLNGGLALLLCYTGPDRWGGVSACSPASRRRSTPCRPGSSPSTQHPTHCSPRPRMARRAAAPSTLHPARAAPRAYGVGGTRPVTHRPASRAIQPRPRLAVAGGGPALDLALAGACWRLRANRPTPVGAESHMASHPPCRTSSIQVVPKRPSPYTFFEDKRIGVKPAVSRRLHSI